MSVEIGWRKSPSKQILIYIVSHMIRTLFWLVFFFGVYLWLVTSGRDETVLEKGKALYNTFVTWFDDAEIEFHFKKDKTKQRSRRWE